MRGDEAVPSASDRVCERESRGGAELWCVCYHAGAAGASVWWFWRRSSCLGDPIRPCSRPQIRRVRTSGIASSPIVSLAFGADGQTIATTDEAGQATLWQAADVWAPVRTLEFCWPRRPSSASLQTAAISPSVGMMLRVRLWDLAEGDHQPWHEIPVRWPSDLRFSARRTDAGRLELRVPRNHPVGPSPQTKKAGLKRAFGAGDATGFRTRRQRAGLGNRNG